MAKTVQIPPNGDSRILDVTPRIAFAPRGPFSRELTTAAKAYFEGSGRSRRDVGKMYVKSAIILSGFVASWVLLVFYARNAVEATACAIAVGLGIAGIGMSIQHDANHGATSKHPWVNRLFGATLDFMGVAGFVWRQKHNVGHHTYTNIQGVDYDLDFGVLARLSPEQPRLAWHRWQHLYLWFFYGFLLPKWVFYDDWRVLFGKFIGKHPLVKPSPGKVAGFFVCKLFFVGWAIVIPALYHPLWQVLIFHMVGCFALGLTLGTVFQLAHCSRDVEFPESPPPGGRMPEWTAHQLATTVDFAPRNPVVTWFVGGLNFQVVHHLFPKVCHVHYPALSRVVERVAQKHGLRYRSHASLAGALIAHFIHLRDLGRPVGAAVAVLPRVPLVPDSERDVVLDPVEPTHPAGTRNRGQNRSATRMRERSALDELRDPADQLRGRERLLEHHFVSDLADTDREVAGREA